MAKTSPFDDFYTEREWAAILFRLERQRRIGPPWIKLNRSVLYHKAGAQDWLASLIQYPVRNRTKQQPTGPGLQIERFDQSSKYGNPTLLASPAWSPQMEIAMKIKCPKCRSEFDPSVQAAYCGKGISHYAIQRTPEHENIKIHAVAKAPQRQPFQSDFMLFWDERQR